MYAYLDGQLAEINPAFAVIDCNGVGYMVHISLNTFSEIKDKARVRLYTHLTVREDAHVLYGFSGEEERALFRHLISVSGIGANTARMILSSLTATELVQAIASGNESLLKRIKGIGAKSAQRILIDLKDKIGKVHVVQGLFPHQGNRNIEEALSGLVILGFNKPVAGKALEKVSQAAGGNLSVEMLIKEALKIL
jgi:Holliday junction DNA helicase RuvA